MKCELHSHVVYNCNKIQIKETVKQNSQQQFIDTEYCLFCCSPEGALFTIDLLLGIGLPVHDLASWFVSTTILGWFCVSMVWHHGLYHFPWNRLACLWFGFMVCIYNNTGMAFCVYGLASWFIPLWLEQACLSIIWLRGYGRLVW